MATGWTGRLVCCLALLGFPAPAHAQQSVRQLQRDLVAKAQADFQSNPPPEQALYALLKAPIGTRVLGNLLPLGFFRDAVSIHQSSNDVPARCSGVMIAPNAADSLRCDATWLGVWVRLGDETREWRGFVPVADVAPEVPKVEQRVAFADNSTPTEASQRELETLARSNAARKGGRWRILTRALLAGGDKVISRDRQLAILRQMDLERIIRAQLPVGGTKPPIKVELVETEDSSFPQAIVQAYYE